MKTAFCISLLIGITLFLHTADCNNFCYRATFTTDAAVNGTVEERSTEIETAVLGIINEYLSINTDGFAVNDFNSTLEDIYGNATQSNYVVKICLDNSTRTASELTPLLQAFNPAMQIDSSQVTIDDYDECAFNYCHPVASCNNTDGSFSCACPADDYEDLLREGIPGLECKILSPANHTCARGEIEVRAYFPYFSSKGINETELTLGNCIGSLDGDLLTFNGSCSPAVESNKTHILFMWNLTNIVPDPDVTVGTYVTIPFVCASPATGNISKNVSGIFPDGLDFQESLFIDSGQSSLDVNIEAFLGSSFSTSLQGGSPIKTNTDLSFKMGPPEGFISSNLKTVCQGLTSQPAEGFGSPVRLIQNGCKSSSPSISTLLNTLSIKEQGTASQASVSLRSHFYTNSQLTKLTFEVNICLESGGNSCQPSCSSRRKRSLVHVITKRSSNIAAGIGTFSFVRDLSDDVCTRDCGTGACVIDALRIERCVCPENSYLDREGKCIFRDEPEDQRKSDASDFLIVLLYAVIGVLVVAGAALSVVLWRQRKKEKVVESA